MKTILFLIDSLATGGAEHSVLLLMQYLIGEGHRTKLVLLKETSPAYRVEDFDLTPDMVYCLQASGRLSRTRELLAIIKAEKAAILHSTLFQANLLGRQARMLYPKFKHLESLVNLTYAESRLKDPSVTKIKLEAYRLLDKYTQAIAVDGFHAITQAAAAHHVDKLGIRTKRIKVIYRGRDKLEQYRSERDKMRAELSVDADELLLINVARHEYQKAQEILLAAFAQANLPKVKLILVGREGKLTPLIKQQIEALSLAQKVTILGYRSDVPALLAAADIMVFPSRHEGLGGALIEAMAMGLPIICTDTLVLREVVVYNENALMFPVDDVKQCCQHIIHLVNNPSLRAAFAQKSRAQFTRKFELQNIHAAMLAWYHSFNNL